MLAGIGVAQQPPPPPAPAPAPASAPAIVSYAVASERRDPRQFSVQVDLVGHATYEAAESTGEGEPAEPFRVEFDVSPSTRDRIFALTQGVDYFQGDFEFRKHAVADTGRKTLRYQDGARTSETTFNWSENKQIQQLTDIFESIALTQGLARKLAHLRRYDKLGLDAVLKRMEELRKANYLGELQAIAPLLRQIANDPGVMKLARDRARRLLDQVDAAALPPASASPK